MSIWACAVLGEASSAKANTDTVQRAESWTAAVRNVHGVSLNNAAPSDATGPD
ncbi:hypothetical protein HaLaN_22108, partial [Haematococcus lacustris]